MTQQISIEAAYGEFESKAVELFKENVLLRARLKELEQANKELRENIPAESPSPEPAAAYPVEAGYEPGRSGI